MLSLAASDLIPLSGSADGAQPGLVTALADVGGTPCVVIGQDRDGQREHGPLGPAALRQAGRCIRVAAELGLPVVTFIDMPGMALSRESEEGGLSAEIASCLAELLALPSPAVAVLLGEGAGGGALALLPADRIIAVADAWLAPLPEGSSAIVHKGDTSFAAELADAQGGERRPPRGGRNRRRDRARAGRGHGLLRGRSGRGGGPRTGIARSVPQTRRLPAGTLPCARLTRRLSWLARGVPPAGSGRCR
ncbi:MAG TPA: carboxyl transferase domain-containing protein [Trebonia sp.]